MKHSGVRLWDANKEWNEQTKGLGKKPEFTTFKSWPCSQPLSVVHLTARKSGLDMTKEVSVLSHCPNWSFEFIYVSWQIVLSLLCGKIQYSHRKCMIEQMQTPSFIIHTDKIKSKSIGAWQRGRWERRLTLQKGALKKRADYYSATIFSLLDLIFFRTWNIEDYSTRNCIFCDSMNSEVEEAEP